MGAEAAARRLTPPPRAAVVPHECGAERDGAKCAQPARLYASGWRCDDDAPWAHAGRPSPLPVPSGDAAQDSTT